MKGFGSGLIWGALAGAFGLVIASETSPLPVIDIASPVAAGASTAAPPETGGIAADPAAASVSDGATPVAPAETASAVPVTPEAAEVAAAPADEPAAPQAATPAPATEPASASQANPSAPATVEVAAPNASGVASPETSQVDVPAGSEFAKALPETDPALPMSATAPETGAVPAVAEPGASPALPVADTPPAVPQAPDASGPAAPAAPEGDTSALQVASNAEAPIGAVAAIAPTAPLADAAPDAGQPPPPPPLTPQEQAQADAARAPDAAGELANADEVAPDPEPVAPPEPQITAIEPAPTAPEDKLLKPVPVLVPVQPLPDIGKAAAPESPAQGSVVRPATGLANSAAGVITGRLPQIGAAPKTDAMAKNDAIDPATMLPIDRYARTFKNPEGKPAFAIILIDRGDPGLNRATLAALPFPVTFALDPTLPNVAELAAPYRAAGQEVVMLATGIPAGATAADLEVTFAAHAAALPEAVALLDLPEGGFQGDRPLATQVVPILKGQGRGLLTYDTGLNPADQVASRDQLRAATIFRRLDAEGEPVAAIRRYLDRAAFKAAQEGHVAVIGEARPETVAALMEWSVEGRAAAVALAPVTAVLVSR